MAVVIIGAARTPMGGFQGALSQVAATELGAVAIRGALTNGGISNDAVGEVLMGCVLPAGLGQAPARQAALGAGLPQSVPCTAINKVCGSGMKTVMMAHDQIIAGSHKRSLFEACSAIQWVNTFISVRVKYWGCPAAFLRKRTSSQGLSARHPRFLSQL